MTMRIKKAKAQADFADSSDTVENSIKSNNNDTKNVKKKDQKYFDPMAVTWMEKYSDQMERMWRRLPNFVGSAIVTCAIFLLGATMRGEWLIVLVHAAKHLGYGGSDDNETSTNVGDNDYSWEKISLEHFYLKNVVYYWLASVTVSYTMYCGIGGFVHWYFYVRQRDKADEWKCQPKKWLTPELERDEIILGSLSLFCVSTVSAFLASYSMNGGPSMIYYKLDEYTWTYWFLSWPVIYIYMDYVTYWLHRAYHTPFLYKNFHKLHHKYKTPTAFSVTAMHPVELVSFELVLCMPIFVVPINWVPFCTITMYNYYHGIIDHCGVNFKSFWWQPWQPDAIFHDNHHQYFHVNFGFNCLAWDKIHGTYRQKDRIYTEDTYYGRGKSLSEASESELKSEIEERNSENPLAYRGNVRIYALSEEELNLKKD